MNAFGSKIAAFIASSAFVLCGCNDTAGVVSGKSAETGTTTLHTAAAISSATYGYFSTETTITIGEQIEISGKGAKIKDDQITITSGGLFTLTGSLSGGSILITAKAPVRLVLDAFFMDTGEASAIQSLGDELSIATEAGNSRITGSGEAGTLISAAGALELGGQGVLELAAGTDGTAIDCGGELRFTGGEYYIDAGTGIRCRLAVFGGGSAVITGGAAFDTLDGIRLDGGVLYAEALQGISPGQTLELISGKLLMIGAGGGLDGFSVITSGQTGFRVQLGEAIREGSEVMLSGGGEGLVELVANADFSGLMVSSPNLRMGDEITISENGAERARFVMEEEFTEVQCGLVDE